MKYNKKQLQIINAKKNGFNLIKGNKSTGKTTAAMQRTKRLLNSYCLENSDNVLIIMNSEESLKETKAQYLKIGHEKVHQESFFEKTTKESLKMKTIDNIAFSLFTKYKSRNKNKHTLINTKIKHEILDEILKSLIKEENSIKKYKFELQGNRYNFIPNKRFLSKFNINVLADEIKFIKSFNYCEDEYMQCERKKYINTTIRKNSQERMNIYSILRIYNDIMKNLYYVDSEDLFIIALDEARKGNALRYTHIFVDEAQEYTKVQLNLCECLLNKKAYSNFTYIIDNNIENELAYLKFYKNLNKLGHDFRGRTKLLTEVFSQESEEKFNMPEIKEKVLTRKTYIDLKHNRSYTYVNDDDDKKEIYTITDDREEKEENLSEIPMFNEIAAGRPILMNDSIEDTLYIPSMWLRGANNTFILKIKGDSMVGKNINDGDYVVIDSTKNVNDNDVVAVELGGEATLKTFKNEKTRLLFKPENEKYSPIVVTEDDDFNILGVAIGIIKN